MQLILFDLDGTLIDSEEGILASMEHAFTRMGHQPPARAHMRGWIGPPLRHTFPSVVGDDPERIEQAVAHYRERFDTIGWAEHAVFPGIAELVDGLAQRELTLAIVTTKVQVQAQRIVDHLPFGRAFGRVYGPGLDGRHCEKAEMIAQALADFGASAQHAVMIGDRYFDIEGALANGVRALGVSWGFGSVDELTTAGAHAIAHTPAELAALLAPAAVT